ncbi:MAG: hypothetical protein HY895_07335 [Deltaproteobacteria bacterium]|nr:hypothetical protein [Deltaproteobacteria bacterium]
MDRQVGVVFLVIGKVVGLDAFGNSATCSRVFKYLIESYPLDTIDSFEKETNSGERRLLMSSWPGLEGRFFSS